MNPLSLPLVAVQGLWVRATTERLPEASGPYSGVAGNGSGAAVRVGVLGESTAAGCGVGSYEDGFTACLARELAERTGRPVEWEVAGRNSVTVGEVRDELLPRLGDGLDAAVLLAGVNDVLHRSSPRKWEDDLSAVLDGLGQRAGRVVMTGVPPFRAFPSLPGALRGYLAERADALDAVSRRVCAGRPTVTWVDSGGIVPAGPEFFARDRFHPSAEGYRRWAQAVAELLAS
ncbi:SGNH/GDSL hydrolase family protein [Spirillospora sp. NPDC029432]|uniref:SGNH/GDSL hydrolase family protein n=1 Tax=Spirillospora sp. NPDC029432 TaxID=3154599 RepID=UPI003456EBA9